MGGGGARPAALLTVAAAQAVPSRSSAAWSSLRPALFAHRDLDRPQLRSRRRRPTSRDPGPGVRRGQVTMATSGLVGADLDITLRRSAASSSPPTCRSRRGRRQAVRAHVVRAPSWRDLGGDALLAGPFAQASIETKNIGIVLLAEQLGRLAAWTSRGRRRLVGKTGELITACSHPAARACVGLELSVSELETASPPAAQIKALRDRPGQRLRAIESRYGRCRCRRPCLPAADISSSMRELSSRPAQGPDIPPAFVAALLVRATRRFE